MKRLLLIFMAFAMLIMSVSCNTDSDDNGFQIKKEENKIKYKADEPLFAAQDRCDVEDDRYKVYSYNYKGDLISASDSLTVGYYAENGLAPAPDRQTGKIGFVDKEGVFKIEPIYEDAGPFSKHGIALVKMELDENGEKVDKCGYINSKGKQITSFVYDDATSFYNFGYALASDDNNQYIIDTKGDVVAKIDKKYNKISALYEKYYICRENDNIVVFNYSNEKILTQKMENTEEVRYFLNNDGLNRRVGDKVEIFNGKEFTEIKQKYEVVSKHVVTTLTGVAYGLEENGETVIPCAYDMITIYGDYFVCIKAVSKDSNAQIIDIYDKNYKKTAESLPYGFSVRRTKAYGEDCQLPNGYFEIVVDNDDYGVVYGIIDYTGKVIVEPVYGRGIHLYTYESAGVFPEKYTLY